MHTRSSFDYAVFRVVPRVEREEFLNVGVVLFCPEQRFLDLRLHRDEHRLLHFSPRLDIEEIRRHLEALGRVGRSEPDGGPVARLAQRERFHWLVAPRSTMLQVSPVHSGLCDQPAAMLEQLFSQLVLI